MSARYGEVKFLDPIGTRTTIHRSSSAQNEMKPLTVGELSASNMSCALSCIGRYSKQSVMRMSDISDANVISCIRALIMFLW
jgi:hypothetical protein